MKYIKNGLVSFVAISVLMGIVACAGSKTRKQTFSEGSLPQILKCYNKVGFWSYPTAPMLFDDAVPAAVFPGMHSGKDGYYVATEQTMYFYSKQGGPNFEIRLPGGQSIYLKPDSGGELNYVYQGSHLFGLTDGNPKWKGNKSLEFSKLEGGNAWDETAKAALRLDLRDRIESISTLYRRYIASYEMELAEYRKEPKNFGRERLRNFLKDIGSYTQEEARSINVERFVNNPEAFITRNKKLVASKAHILSNYRAFLHAAPNAPESGWFIPDDCTKVEEAEIRNTALEEIDELKAIPIPGAQATLAN